MNALFHEKFEKMTQRARSEGRAQAYSEMIRQISDVLLRKPKGGAREAYETMLQWAYHEERNIAGLPLSER